MDLLNYCIEAEVYGIINFGMGMTLRDGNREYFYRQLDRLFPGLKERYINYYGNQYILSSPNENRLLEIFNRVCDKHNIVHNNEKIFEYLRTFEEKSNNAQLSLFDFM